MKHQLTSYKFGSVILDGEPHTKDLLVTDTQVISNWRRQAGHSLVPEDFERYLPGNTETLIIGCGSSGMLVVPADTIAWCNERGIELVSLPTADACRQYNALLEQSSVVIGLHLTC